MTLESTVPSTEATGDTTRYALDPLTGAEIETAAAVITDSEYSTPTLKFVMIQLAEPAKTPSLTFEGAEVPRRAFVTMYDGAAKLIYEADRRSRRPDHRLVEVGARPVPVLSRRAHDRCGGGCRVPTRGGRRPCASAVSPTSTSR